MGVAETTYFLSRCAIWATDRRLIMSLFLDGSPLQQHCMSEEGSPALSDDAYLIVDLSALCLTASSMKVVAAVWLCLSMIWSSRFSSGWSVKPQSKTTRCSEGASVQSRGACGLYVCVYFLLSVDWTDAFDCFNVRPILVLSRLTCGMEINDDLHVNGPPSCISQGRGGRRGGVLCLFVYWTFHFLHHSAIKENWTAADTHTNKHTHTEPGQSRSCNTTATGSPSVV